MNTKLSLITLALLLFFGRGLIVTQAQIDTDVTIDANITHPFIVQNTTLPAGKYTVRVLDENEPNDLEIRSADGRVGAAFDTEFVQANRATAPNDAELIFDEIGGKYFLSQVFTGGSKMGNQVLKSRMEKKLEDGGLQAAQHTLTAKRGQAKVTKKRILTIFV